MSRYYESEALIEFVKQNTPHMNGETTMKCVEFAIKNAPTTDVVEVVRCKDCKYFEPDESTPFGICICKNGVNYLAEVTPHKEHFCSYGERED